MSYLLGVFLDFRENVNKRHGKSLEGDKCITNPPEILTIVQIKLVKKTFQPVISVVLHT